MEAILEKADTLYKEENCCHDGRRHCDCGECWTEKFRRLPDDYNCFKSLCWYTMKYGPSFASELYHYLCESQLIERFQEIGKQNIKILSLGCGLGPDLFAINKYIEDTRSRTRVRYIGADKQAAWSRIRIAQENAKFEQKDVLEGLDLSRYDLIFLCKLISTLKRNNKVNEFYSILTNAINSTLHSDCCLVFVDVNSCHTGRDEFCRIITPLFSTVRQFYFDTPPYIDRGWRLIPNNHVVFDIPNEISISPLRLVAKDVVFEYWK